MSKFPIERAKIMEVASDFQNGETQHPTEFQDAPVKAADIGAAVATVTQTQATRQAKQAELDAAVQADQAALSRLSALLVSLLEWARGQKKRVPNILKWLDYAEDGGPGAIAPGVPRHFEILHQLPHSTEFDWKGGIIGTNVGAGEGAKAAFYEFVVRESAGEAWFVLKTTPKSDVIVTMDELRAKFGSGMIEAAVRGVNTNGTGPECASITLMVP